ncbi:MAG: ATPase, T2SS/T4P/T4SS family, partial [Burkholderiaceae bacterium]
MNAATETKQDNVNDVDSQLDFSKKLQAVTNKIHATDNVDEIMLGLSRDICDLFHCDRITLYAVSKDKNFIVSKVKTGLNTFSDLELPVSTQSIAGYAAHFKRIVRIKDVYDDAELQSHNPPLSFLRAVDQRTGYRTKQMLVAPLIDTQNNELMGVVQLINNRHEGPFSAMAEAGLKELCETLTIAFNKRLKPTVLVHSKYNALVSEAIISAPELELATRSARRKNMDMEDVLIGEFQVKLPAIGQALAKHFGVAYEPFKAERINPVDLLKNIKRDYVEQNKWLPLEDSKEVLIILAVDPEQVKSTRVVTNIFPKAKPVYRVTTNREFQQTVDLFYGAQGDTTSVSDMLLGMGEDDDDMGDAAAADISAAAENELVKLVNKIVVDAYRQGASDIHIEPRPGKDKTLIRFRKDGSLENYIEIPASYRHALSARIKIMCDLDISERRKPQDGKIKFKKFGPLDIELRVATIPSAGGVEDIVMRILAAGEPIPLDKLGVLPHNLDRLKTVVSKPYGLFFVCGPTGSGKTTTLHS